LQFQIPDVASRFLKDNATTVLTAGGVVGTVATAVLSVRAGFKASTTINKHVAEQQALNDEPLLPSDFTTAQKVKLVAPHFVPPVVMGGLTIGSIVFAHRMSATKAAALAAAYGVSQKQLEEYKAKVAETLGVAKAKKVQDELAKDDVERSADRQSHVIILGDHVLCYDRPTDRYFQSTMEKIRQAEAKANREILETGYYTTTEFYNSLGLDETTWSNDTGWHRPFELEYSTVSAKDGRPCLAINFSPMPDVEYMKAHSRYSP
jgi:hypothetical protein